MSKWRDRGYYAEIRLRKAKLTLWIAWAKIVAARYYAELQVLRFIHYATGGQPVVVEPEIEDGGHDE